MKSVSERWVKDINDRISFSADSGDQFKRRITTMLSNQYNALSQKKATPEDIKNRTHSSGSWVANLNEIEMQYLKLHSRWSMMNEQEEYSLSIERRANRIALVYRFLTTIAVGLGIMGIYGLAHYLGIPMPLMRLPM